MTKKKHFWEFCLFFIKDHLIVYVTYSICLGLIAATFYLYHISFEAYKDAVLFSLTFLGIVSIVSVMWEWRAYCQLARSIKKKSFLSLIDLPKPSSLKEIQYQQIIQLLVSEIRENESKQELANQELKNYYALWTHQIKTPLAALDLLVQSLGESKQVLMKPELFKMNDYLNMMLTYIKLNHVNEDLVIQSVSISQLVKDVIKKYQTFFIQKDLFVTFDMDNWTVITDKIWLSFILEQVIFNAIKYTKKGGITVYRENESLLIRDSGIGILPEDLPRIFEKGYTGFNGHATQKASGLGLYMSRNVADRLGIEMSIHSKVGEGTCVRLTFKQDDYSLNPSISNLTLL